MNNKCLPHADYIMKVIWCSWSFAHSIVETTNLLTVMAGGANVARVTAVTIEGGPGLGTASSMFTVVWQTPSRR